VLIEGRRDEIGSQTGLFLYEAALSGRFGPIETIDDWVQIEGDGRRQEHRVVRRWSRAEGPVCAAVATSALDASPERYESPQGQEHDLVRGVCLLGRRVNAPTAAYVLPTDQVGGGPASMVLRTRSGGATAASVSDREPDWRWRLFGLSRANATLWDDSGEYRRPDPVSDAALIAALEASPPLRSAALEVLQNRVLPAGMSDSARPLHEVRATGRSVGLALARSGRMADPDPWKRGAALRAAAAVPAAADVLTPEIVQALHAPTVEASSAQAQAQRERVLRALPGAADLFDDGRPKPGAAHAAVIAGALHAAARMPRAEARRVWDAIEAAVRENPEPLFSHRGAFLRLAEHVGAGEALAHAWRARTAQPPWIKGLSVALLRAAYPHLSLEGRRLAEEGCTPPLDTARERPCALLAWRRGDRAVLDLIEQRALGAAGPPDPGYWSASGAAWSLLEDFGAEGRRRLLRLAARAEGRYAVELLTAACHLGPKAGTAVKDRAASVAAAAPEDGDGDLRHRLKRAAERCAATQPTEVGASALADQAGD
jgi:hypothetical protein